jgi:hypothetical protein
MDALSGRRRPPRHGKFNHIRPGETDIGYASKARALLGASPEVCKALCGHCNLKRSFKKALTPSWDLFAAASW